ncbi:MAG: esterase-like activity of phytase family protein [Pseudomonadota bacterium]
MHAHKKLIALALAGAFASGSAAAVDLIAIGTLAMGADKSSATAGLLENGVAGNLLGGIGSGLAYAGNGMFIATPDRGPNASAWNGAIDDTTSYIPRFQSISMAISASAPGSALPFAVTPTLTNTTLLSSNTPLTYGPAVPSLNGAGHYYFSGRSDNFNASVPSMNPNNARLDPEGVRVSADGKSVFVSDEYGPYVYQFDRASGQRLRSYALPANLAVGTLSGKGDTEIAGNTSGRVANKGMEGLAISPDGKTLVGIMQANLIQDGKNMLRIVTVDVASGATHEYAYKLTTGSGVSEIVALNDHQFLVDERDGKGLGDGSKAVVKQLFMIDLAGAADIKDLASIGAATPVLGKTLFLDVVPALLAHGFTASTIPAKMEGLAFGQDITVGGTVTHTLWLANDNDFTAAAGDNKFFVFGVTDADLAHAGATLVPQSIASVPEPQQLGMLLSGLLLMGVALRRRR